MKNKKLALLAGIAVIAGGAVLLCSPEARATTTSVTANIAFENNVTLTKNADIDFGTVAATTAGNYTIDTTPTVTPAGGGVWLFGTPAAGDVDIDGANQTINITTGAEVAGGIGNGVTVSNETCAYNGGAEVSCNDASLDTAAAPNGVTKNLLIGAKVTTDNLQTAGTAATPSFTLTVVYN
jgi:hypothetical protein